MKALETEKSAADERVSELQAKIVDETSNGGDVGEGADVSAGGSEALQKELSLTLTNLAKASTEVHVINGGWGLLAVRRIKGVGDPLFSNVQSSCLCDKGCRVTWPFYPSFAPPLLPPPPPSSNSSTLFVRHMWARPIPRYHTIDR